jgi:hypothetical protein
MAQLHGCSPVQGENAVKGSLVFVFYVMILLGISGLAKADGEVIVNMTCTWSDKPQGVV